MKYSYMPKYRHKIEFGSCWFDSEETIIDFRNQYSKRFIFAPMSTARLAILVSLTIGFIVGKLL